MPRRSNSFQRLVFLIQHQLAAGARVTESKFLPDKRSGRSVEVDVVVEGTLGGVALVIGVECTSGNRKATVEWVDQMLGKHNDLPLDKTVLVSRSGFTAEAKAKAEAHGVEALHLEEAEARDWSTWLVDVRNLRYATFTLQPEKIEGTLVGAKPESTAGLLVPDATIQEPGKVSTHSLNEYVMGMLGEGRLIRQLSEVWLKRNVSERKEPLSFQIAWACPPGTTITTPLSDTFQLQRIQVKVRATAQDAPFAASVSKFRERNVVHAEVHGVPTDRGSTEMLVTLFEKDGVLSAGTAMLIEPGTSTSRVVPLRFPKSTNDGDS